ncbi:uncharacterized protein LOC121400096 [Xenopus laevis]|uniref:Uncharacterized protein LOC121400096 n=2 Tax=Xenopus laevis TaxID=8355 RepID=A0A1L8HJW8_XENLA|nr:uncharacterized protein LOC121400096 [Xenopus laevis]OCT96331.1 hypothetical protein XELAEV_18014007mg [Xenopus laevis]
MEKVRRQRILKIHKEDQIKSCFELAILPLQHQTQLTACHQTKSIVMVWMSLSLWTLPKRQPPHCGLRTSSICAVKGQGKMIGTGLFLLILITYCMCKCFTKVCCKGCCEKDYTLQDKMLEEIKNQIWEMAKEKNSNSARIFLEKYIVQGSGDIDNLISQTDVLTDQDVESFVSQAESGIYKAFVEKQKPPDIRTAFRVSQGGSSEQRAVATEPPDASGTDTECGGRTTAVHV